MSYMKPTVKLGAKNPQMATIGHLLALIGGLIALIFGILGLGVNILFALLAIIVGGFVAGIELDMINVPAIKDPLKDPLVRGIVWIILPIFFWGLGPFSGLLVIIAGVLYLVYHFS